MIVVKTQRRKNPQNNEIQNCKALLVLIVRNIETYFFFYIIAYEDFFLLLLNTIFMGEEHNKT